jgi:hypothetical protein
MNSSGGPSSDPPRRFVWCSAAGQVLHGRTRPGPTPRASLWQRLLGREASGGTIYEFEAIELEPALRALARHLADPGAFSIETTEGARLDFLASRRSPEVTIDCWFFGASEELAITRTDAPELVTRLYQPLTDHDVSRFLLALAERRAAA